MTTTNVLPAEKPRALQPVDISPMRCLYWSLRREVWENRSIYLAPVAVAGLILIGSSISAFQLPGAINALDPAQQHALIEQPYMLAALLLMFTTMVIAIYYCLEALQGERRDRSILFWKSLPVSDLTTVAAKASIPVVVLPLVTFAVTVITQILMLFLGSVRLALEGVSITTLWDHVPLLQMWPMLLFHLVAGHGLWYAPFYGWLLLISAWARRAPLLWATLPLLAVGLVEKIAFNTSYFASLLAYRFMGSPNEQVTADPMSMQSLSPVAPVQFMNSPGFWAGLAIFTACLGVAVHLRRHRGPV